MKRYYDLPGEPGRNFLDLIATLGPADKLTVEHSATLGSNAKVRAAFLQAILARGMRLRVNTVAPEHQDELREHQIAARKARYARASAAGAYSRCGRSQTIDRGPIKKLLDQGFNGAEISRRLDLPKGTIYRIINELRGAK